MFTWSHSNAVAAGKLAIEYSIGRLNIAILCFISFLTTIFLISNQMDSVCFFLNTLRFQWIQPISWGECHRTEFNRFKRNTSIATLIFNFKANSSLIYVRTVSVPSQTFGWAFFTSFVNHLSAVVREKCICDFRDEILCHTISGMYQIHE